MEKEKKGTSILTIILLIALMASCGYIAYDKFIVKEENEAVVEKEETEEQKEEESKEQGIKLADDEVIVKKGECPLYKFEESYALTEEDKDGIVEAMKKKGVNTVKETIKLQYSKNYYMVVEFATEENPTMPESAILYKVNQQYKEHIHASAFTKDYVEELDNTLNKICS